MCGGIWFHIIGPQTEKARFPNWVRVLTTTAALVVAERSLPATRISTVKFQQRNSQQVETAVEIKQKI